MRFVRVGLEDQKHPFYSPLLPVRAAQKRRAELVPTSEQLSFAVEVRGRHQDGAEQTY